MRKKHEKYLYQLTFLPRLLPVNSYLVEEDNELTLIDAALPYSFKEILRTAESIGKPITKICLTHAHDDHVGGLDNLKNKLPNAKVYISSRDAKLLAGDKSLQADEPNTPIRGGVPKGIQTKPDVLLNEGDAIGSLLTISTPGHTPGSLTFLDTRTNTLIAGDTFQIRGGIAVAGQLRVSFPFPAMATWNKEQALQSAKKLMKYKPALLAVGHGNLLNNPSSAMNHAIREAERKIG
ncbi:MBL fold metallo-hydrolase [Cytobacillus sp. IB215665]|uniref:MBL fold metallo-hydrolase n=1 Tax=Cytobacillus sp. IB215665 TaxID=3097357 RepID=UPI002A18559D|nr:MBL fold metallo-hydrolase [Cytobacillus sp. IB215665]MDX8367065.1 MBL fold metallo-hydrolase [Cytobacillus sp. IB215665]